MNKILLKSVIYISLGLFISPMHGMQKQIATTEPHQKTYNEILGQGILEISRKNYVGAIEPFRQAFQIAPNSHIKALVAAQLSITYSRVGNVEPAYYYAQFAACQKINPDAQKIGIDMLKRIDAAQGIQALGQEFILKQ